MSAPTTCAPAAAQAGVVLCHPPGAGSQQQRHDILFYVLFGANTDYFRALIEESVLNIAREYPGADGVADALQLMRPKESDSLVTLQIKFFLLLNEDETMRRALASVRVGHPLVVSLCPHKAERFYDDLCERLVPSWMRTCDVSHADFVDALRASYLCS